MKMISLSISSHLIQILSKQTEQMPSSKPCSSLKSSQADLEQLVDADSFFKSLQELRGLRSHLHYAADYCQNAFSKAQHKKQVVENTKEYICRAVVTVVDHLGTVSANLNARLSDTNPVPETELRIDCIQQRLLSCEIYSHNLALPQLRWTVKMPRYHPRYILNPMLNDGASVEVKRACDIPSSAEFRDKQLEFNSFSAEKCLPVFIYTHTHKPSLTRSLTPRVNDENGDSNRLSAMVLPVDNSLSVLSKAPNSTFHFQSTKKARSNSMSRKSAYGADIFTLIRRPKWTNMKS